MIEIANPTCHVRTGNCEVTISLPRMFMLAFVPTSSVSITLAQLLLQHVMPCSVASGSFVFRKEAEVPTDSQTQLLQMLRKRGPCEEA